MISRRQALIGLATVASAPAVVRDRPHHPVVDTLAELQEAIDNAPPGSRVVLAPGVYEASAPVTIAGKQRIVVTSAGVGKATITGPAGFVITDSTHLTVAGFRFTGSATLRVPVGSDHVRITRNHFELTAGDGAHWLNIDGDDATVDHNLFANKPNLGVYLSVVGPSEEVAKRTRICRNHFFNHTFTGANGGEPIRLGLSSRQRFSAYARVEHNLFEKCDGDPEAISVKSSDNLVRYNTVVNSAGGIVLRHGNRTRVEGNIIHNGERGIRFYGNDHVIVNNQVSGVTGTGISIGSGNVIDDVSSTGNDRPDRVLVAFNTFVNNGGGMTGEANRPLEPHDCVIANNIVQADGVRLVNLPIGEVGFRWEGNLLYGTAGAEPGDIPEHGFRLVDPGLVQDDHGIYRITRRSPAVRAAAGSYPMVGLDLDGSRRREPKDVGADELAWADEPARPLTPADVGPYAR